MRTLSTSTASRLTTWFLSVTMLLATAAPVRAADEPFGDRATCEINNQPDSVTRCYSQTGSVPFYCSWSGIGQARWYVDGELQWTDPDLAASSSTYIHRGRQGAVIRCEWSNRFFCYDVSSNAVFTVLNAPFVNIPPGDRARCVGSNTVLTVDVQAGGAAVTYQWRKGTTNLTNVAGRVAGVTTNRLELSNLTFADAGDYNCVISNVCGTTTSANGTLSIDVPVVILKQPETVKLCQVSGTDSATFKVIVSTEANARYQWYKDGSTPLVNGLQVLGATSNTLTLLDIDAADVGVYECRIVNGCGTVISDSVALTFDKPPFITAHPQPRVLCTGADTTLSVTATPSTGLSFQWTRNDVNLVDGGGVSGATTSVLSLTSVSPKDTGTYRCIVTNGCPSVTSQAASVVVNTLPVITTKPVALSRCSGTTATFTVAATGTPSPTFRWKKGTSYLTNVIGQISGATSASLTLSGIDAADAGTYSCEVSNSCGTVTTDAVALTVTSAPVISTQPAALVQCTGSNAVFTVAATGTPSPTYQWKKGTTNLTNVAGQISGATSATLTLSAIDSNDAGTYSCIVTNACKSITSDEVTLTLNAAPVITTQPVAITQCSGTTASFTVAATGTPAATYQWRKGDTNLSNIAGQVSGATSATLTLSAIDSADAANYSCVVTNVCTSVTSSVVALTVNTGPSITQQPSPLTLCAGNSNATFTVVASGTPTPTYRWQKNAQNLSNIAGEISGATSASLTLTGVDANDAATYRCIITNSCGSTTSTEAVLIVNTGPSITSHPQNASACASTPASFSIATNQLSPDYRWQWRPQGSATWLDLNNGDNLYENSPRLSVSGATASTLSVTPLAGAGSLASFRCVLGNKCSRATSDPADILICASDLTCDTLVDNSDFLVFVVAYNTFDCADPTMPTHCPADFDRDGVVDLTDFQIFVVAYDQLVCS